LACAALVGLLGGANAQSICLGYNQVGTWYTSDDCNATVCSDGKKASVLEFKDEDGNVLQEVNMEAAGCVTVPIPSGTASYDWKYKEPPPDGAIALSWPGVPGVFAGGGASLDTYFLGANTVTLGCVSTEVVPFKPAIAYAFRVHAPDFDAADALVAPILQSGAGTPVPPGVTVGAFVSLVHDGLTATIRSSLADRFEHYVLDIDGHVLADLEAGLEAEATTDGNGWTTVTTVLPMSLTLGGGTVTLRQKGRHDEQASELILAL
jgi:hypothetical protein